MLYSPLSYGDNLHYEKFADGSVKCIEDEIPFDLPDGWAWAKINTIAFVTKLAGFEYTKNIAPGLCEDGIPLFKGKNVQNSTIATVYKGNIIKNLIMDCQSYTKYRPNETTGGIFVSWRRKEELPTGA